jgi:arginine deiminase
MTPYGGHSMTAPLARVIVASPGAAGWDDPTRTESWRELGYLRPPDPERAAREHAALCRLLAEEGAEVLELPPAATGSVSDSVLSLDALYARDATLVTDGGFVELAMRKPARREEPAHHRRFLERSGVPRLGRIEPPGTCEAGDLAWLDPGTLLAGRSYRTNREGLRQLAALLAPLEVEVIEVPIPHRRGPQTCLHLGSLISLLDDTTALVDLPWLAVETVELLERRGIRLVRSEPRERKTLATNVLALGDGRVLALEGNPRTRDRIRDAGFEVRTYEGDEISLNGTGGPTCLTLPLLRRIAR